MPKEIKLNDRIIRYVCSRATFKKPFGKYHAAYVISNGVIVRCAGRTRHEALIGLTNKILTSKLHHSYYSNLLNFSEN
jgi:hypothetical protein